MRDSVEIPAGLTPGVRLNPPAGILRGQLVGGSREAEEKCDRILKPVGAIVTLTAIGGIVGLLTSDESGGAAAMCAGAGACLGVVVASIICILNNCSK